LAKVVSEKASFSGTTNPLLLMQPPVGQKGRSTVIVYRSRPEIAATPNAEESTLVENPITKAEEADLALIDVTSGGVTRIARGFNPEWYEVSPDGSQFAFATLRGIEGGDQNHYEFDLMLINSQRELKLLVRGISRQMREFDASWSPDGKSLSYVAINAQSDGECYIVSVGGELRSATDDPHPAFNDFSGFAPLWDAGGQHLFVHPFDGGIWKITVADRRASEVLRISKVRLTSIMAPFAGGRFWSPDGGRSIIVNYMDDLTKESGFYRLDLATGKGAEVLREPKFYENFHHRIAYSADARKLIYFAQDVGHEPNFWVVGGDFKNPRQLTELNPLLRAYAMGTSRLVEWKTLEGRTIRGALLLPVGFQQGRRYPVIVSVYGGARLSANLNSFGLSPDPDYAPTNKQLFATRGYAVLCPDAPLGDGTPMKDIVTTVLPGVNKLIEIGIADPDRIGLMGVSYGGYSVLSLIVQTTRFKAAIMIAGFGDLVGFSGEMDENGVSLGKLIQERWFANGRMPGEPWDHPQVYIQNSPIFFLNRIQTPLLIIHGGNDRNVAPFLADEIFVSLRRLRKAVVYAKYASEGHEIRGPDNQIDFCNRMIAWFDKYLKPAQSPN
jgi:dipeptidyl aminopeptidase/acylaminoacyl peptidase